MLLELLLLLAGALLTELLEVLLVDILLLLLGARLTELFADEPLEDELFVKTLRFCFGVLLTNRLSELLLETALLLVVLELGAFETVRGFLDALLTELLFTGLFIVVVLLVTVLPLGEELLTSLFVIVLPEGVFDFRMVLLRTVLPDWFALLLVLVLKSEVLALLRVIFLFEFFTVLR